MDIWIHDLKHSIRSLSRQRTFSLVAIVTITLCIAANSTIFSVVNAVILRPLPYPDSDRILTVYNSYPEAQEERAGNSIPDYFDRREQIDVFEEAGLYQFGGSIIGEGDAKRHAFQLRITPSLFRVLGAQPHLGRLLEEDDGEPGNQFRIVISHSLWQSYYGGDPDVVGQSLMITENRYEIVGVLQEGFSFPTWEAVIWMPMAFDANARSDGNRYSGGPEMLAKLRPGATVASAREQVEALNAATLESYPPELQTTVRNAGFYTEILTFQDDLIADVRTPLLLLWGGVLFVLLIACVNIANLLIVWTSSRSKDFAVRQAVGAGQFRIVRQVLTESLSLTVVGGALGLLVGFWAMDFLDRFEVYEVPRMTEVGMDVSVFGFILLLICLIGFIAGVIPAVRLLKGDLSSACLTSTRAPTAGKQTVALQNFLVSSQIAVTFVLTIGAGLMFATMRNALAVDPGFEPSRILGGAVALPWERYSDPASRINFMDAAISELRAQPSIEDAAITADLPFSGSDPTNVVTPEGLERSASQSIFTSRTRYVSSSYFDVMGIPLLSGRGFTSNDGPNDLPVVIVDDWYARRYWPQGNAIGSRVAFSASPDENSTWYTIVGIVGSIKHNDLVKEEATGAVYRVLSQGRGATFFRLAMKTRGDPIASYPDVDRAIKRVDEAISPFWTVNLEETINTSLMNRRIPMWLLLAASGVGILLATLGVYGVLAYAVNRRTREIGIRIALGGTSDQIVRLVGKHWIKVVGIGLVVGFGGALALTRLLESLLFGVSPNDPLVLLSAMLTLALVSSIAYLIPAWRAAKVDPVQVLNVE